MHRKRYIYLLHYRNTYLIRHKNRKILNKSHFMQNVLRLGIYLFNVFRDRKVLTESDELMMSYFLKSKKIPEEISESLLNNEKSPPNCFQPTETYCPICGVVLNESGHDTTAIVYGVGVIYPGIW